MPGGVGGESGQPLPLSRFPGCGLHPSVRTIEFLFALQFVSQCGRAVDLAQRFDHSGGVDSNSAILCAIVDEVAGVPADQVTPEKNFVDDLDIDSLSMVEIAVAAQDRFGVEIPDDQLKNLKTVQDVVNYVRSAEVSA